MIVVASGFFISLPRHDDKIKALLPGLPYLPCVILYGLFVLVVYGIIDPATEKRYLLGKKDMV
jgi:hypothetical protein